VYRKLAGELDVVRSLAFDADGMKLHRKSKMFGVTAGAIRLSPLAVTNATKIASKCLISLIPAPLPREPE
jgi:hypothetical protein